MASSHHMFTQASNFQMNKPIFTTSTVNVTYHEPQHESNAPSKSISNVLQCPMPSQYFVGRNDTLRQLCKIFSAQIVTISSSDGGALHAFVKHTLKFPSIITVDASSVLLLTGALAEETFSPDSILVLENANVSVLEDSLCNLPRMSVIVTSTDPAISSTATSFDWAFQLPEKATVQELGDLSRSIKEAIACRQRTVTLVANGGTGKTQVVLEFVAKNTFRFSNVWFFDATSDDTLTAGFKELGKASGIGEDIKQVQNFLERMKENWLCIFDNADDKKVFLKEYVPSCNHGNVIVTSRLIETTQMASPGCDIRFCDLEKENAVELLLKHAHMETHNETKSLVYQIVDALSCHALAVATAGAYISGTPTCTVENYLAHFQWKQSSILQYRMKTVDKYHQSVFSAFELSFDALSCSSRYFIQVCAFLNPTVIPLALFKRAAAFTGDDLCPADIDPPKRSIKMLKEFFSLFTQADSWEDSVAELCQLSLASYNNQSQLLSFHPVIHTCALETVTCQDRSHMGNAAILLLGRATPLGDTNEDYEFRRQLIKHASHTWKKSLPTVRVTICLARIFRDCGFWDQTEKLLETAFLLHKQLVRRHCQPSAWTCMSNFILMCCGRRKSDSAKKLNEDVRFLRNQDMGEHHPHTLSVMAHLASAYRACGKLEAAAKLHEEVVLLHKEINGKHSPDTLTSMVHLASTYWALGKLEDSKKLQEEVLMLRLNNQFMDNHQSDQSDTLTSMANMAFTYRTHGQLELAEKLQKDVLRLQKQVLGVHHPDTLTSMANLADTYRAHAKLEAAIKIEEEVLPLRKRVIGEHHPDTLTSMANLASTYWEAGNLEAAVKMDEEVLPLRRQILGEHHPHTLISISNLALTYSALGWCEVAAKLEEEVLALRKEVSGENHPHTLSCMASLASTYYALGKLDEAEELGTKVLLLRKGLIGEDHPDTLTSMSNLASTYHAQGKLDLAQTLEQDLNELQIKTPGLRLRLLNMSLPNSQPNMNSIAF